MTPFAAIGIQARRSFSARSRRHALQRLPDRLGRRWQRVTEYLRSDDRDVVLATRRVGGADESRHAQVRVVAQQQASYFIVWKLARQTVRAKQDEISALEVEASDRDGQLPHPSDGL